MTLCLPLRTDPCRGPLFESNTAPYLPTCSSYIWFLDLSSLRRASDLACASLALLSCTDASRRCASSSLTNALSAYNVTQEDVRP